MFALSFPETVGLMALVGLALVGIFVFVGEARLRRLRRRGQR